MNRPCPRCGQNLIIHARGPAIVTCPVCLASVRTGSGPLPAPPLPILAMPIPAAPLSSSPPLPLQYLPLRDDVEAELERDFRWVLYGIATFAVGSIIALFVIIPQMDVEIPAIVSLAAITIMTSIVAAWLLTRYGRTRREALASGVTTRHTTGERVVGLITLTIGGIVVASAMFFISTVVVVILFLVACFSGGFKL